MAKTKNKHSGLIWSIVFSAILLILFLVLQSYEVKFLKLHYKWILVSLIPIIIALIFGKYITSFKGFGIELEANLKEPLPMTLLSENDTEPLPGFLKSNLDRLETMPESEKRKINRLTFIYGKKGHYDESVSKLYFQTLKYLEYLEIVNEKGEFMYLIPINSVFPKNKKDEYDVDTKKIEKFIRAIENDDFKHHEIQFTYVGVISDYIKINNNLMEAYNKIKTTTRNKIWKGHGQVKFDMALPVVNNDYKMIGIIYLKNIETRIAEEVSKEYEHHI